MERIGIYGGTFNPPHMGHMRAAAHAVDALGLDRLILIPDRIAPHKQIPADTATPQQRLDMLRLACADIPRAVVSDMELRRPETSYTYRTIEQLHGEYPDAELILLMGTDMFLSFPTWKNPQIILRHASLGVFYRGDADETETVAHRKAELEAQGHRVYLTENPVLDISSTQLRRMLAFQCAQPFLAPQVMCYIRGNDLYEVNAQRKALPLPLLEQVSLRLHDPRRVQHVLGCRDMAVQLARRWGADENTAARAALLHDITKALDGPLQLTLCREYGIIPDKFSAQYPKTLHAFTGSLVAARIFGEEDAVVQAIRSHTTGKPRMDTLQMLLYLADYVEPTRDFPGVQQLRELVFTDLSAAMRLGLTMTLEHLRRHGEPISPDTIQTLARLERDSED